jgi:RND family efflux transporter MFP subunit
MASAQIPGRPLRVIAVSFAASQTQTVYSGVVAAHIQAELGFRIGGQIIARPVELGAHVAAGHVLARIDPADLLLDVQAAQAAVQEAQTSATNAAAAFNRYAALGQDRDAMVPEEYDRRKAVRDAALARLTQAQEGLAIARDQASYGVLRADAAGVITALPVEVGQVVAAGQKVASLAHDGGAEIDIAVPEDQLSAMQIGRAATITLWALPDAKLLGHISDVDAIAVPQSRTYLVKIALDQPAVLAGLGMTAAVSFDQAATPRAALPASAIVARDGAPAVWVLQPDGHVIQEGLQIAGYTADGDVEVASGGALRPGALVVTAGAALIDPQALYTPWAGPQR